MNSVKMKEMIGVTVVTRMDVAVGRVSDMEIDADTGHLLGLHIKTRGKIFLSISHELRVSWIDVIEMRTDRVVIRDACVSLMQEQVATQPAPSPSLMKEMSG